MSFITGLTRMWLTRTAKPFTFKNGYDQILPYAECENLGLYVHIPFCKSICNFCPYCKVRYSAELCDRYIDSLIQEIHIVGSQHAEHRKATSLYFGGGTPALAANRIKEIVNALSEHFIITEGIGLELHPDNVNVETLQMLKDAGVTKISIGIQSFCDKYQKILGRKKIDTAEMMSALSAVSFETVSMDFIFALPGQTYDDLKSDIDTAFLLGANHVAIYPFIDFTFTESPVTAMPKKDKRELLDAITQYSTRVTAEDFEKFFGVSLKKMYGFELWVAKQLGLVKEHNGTYEMTLKGAFYYHYYENFYTLSYIDKMWGIMRKEAFPEQIEL